MGKSFRADELNQSLLFPPSLHDWLPDNHLARFLADVVNALDLEAIYSSYNDKDGRWVSAYAPAMITLEALNAAGTCSRTARCICWTLPLVTVAVRMVRPESCTSTSEFTAPSRMLLTVPLSTFRVLILVGS